MKSHFSFYLFFFFCSHSFARLLQNKLIIGNWKSFVSTTDASLLAYSIHQSITKSPIIDKQIVLMPSLLHFTDIYRIFSDTNIQIGTQHCSEHPMGAYTGEVSAQSLVAAGCTYCLVGHNERRKYCREREFHFYERILQLLSNNIIPVFCLGDTYQDLQNGNTIYTCLTQIRGLITFLADYPEAYSKISQIVFVYEPVWAIGTGLTPDGPFADQVYSSIYSFLLYRYKIQPLILYGGSVQRENLYKMKTYNGLLVGKASVNAETFMDICRMF